MAFDPMPDARDPTTHERQQQLKGADELKTADEIDPEGAAAADLSRTRECVHPYCGNLVALFCSKCHVMISHGRVEDRGGPRVTDSAQRAASIASCAAAAAAGGKLKLAAFLVDIGGSPHEPVATFAPVDSNGAVHLQAAQIVVPLDSESQARELGAQMYQHFVISIDPRY